MPRFPVVLLILLSLGSARAAEPAHFATPVQLKQLDAATYAEWVAGVETVLPAQPGPKAALNTPTSQVEWQGVKFGSAKQPGPRHLRVGFTEPIAVGALLVRGGGTVKVLKPSAAYPGKLDDESQWIPAERLMRKENSTSESANSLEVGREGYALWTLPAGTKTRAIRFTHVATGTETAYEGWLGGAYLLAERVANLAPFATATSWRNQPQAHLLNNESNDKTWSTWESLDSHSKEPITEPLISEKDPGTILLTWSRPVELRGLCALWAGFGQADVQEFIGAADLHPRAAPEASWKTLTTWEKVSPQYPQQLGPNWLDFGKTVKTRAIRLRVTKVMTAGHPHVQGNAKGGKRIWLGELMALAPGGEQSLTNLVPATETNEPNPPIAIPFTLSVPSIVTLVIDDANHKRVRNLIAETPFSVGEHVVYWDGLDDLGRDVEAARHGIYNVPGKLVTPGVYHVNGLAHGGIDLRYEFPIYTAGSPAWNTTDNTGAWLANHSPPSAALFVPADRSHIGKDVIYLGSYVSEGTHGLVWTDLDGKKLGGMNWVGGNWTGAPFLALDRGDAPAAGQFVFTGSVWTTGKAKGELELRLNVLTKDGAKEVVKHTWTVESKKEKGEDVGHQQLAGIAAHNGRLAVSLHKLNKILFVSVVTKKVIGEQEVADPRGLAFDAKGRLLVLSGNQLKRLELRVADDVKLATNEGPLASDLDDPQHVTTDADGNLYISEHGHSHQVKVFPSAGAKEPLGKFGLAGSPRPGKYDPRKMQTPAGLTLDDRGRLWVAEADEQPKKISVWAKSGELEKFFLGPAEYGGGGRLDPNDPSKFYYHGMEFKLDWAKGSFELARIFFRPGQGDLGLPGGEHHVSGMPDTAINLKGKRYFSNHNTCNPTGGTALAMLWYDAGPDKPLQPVAAVGSANVWPALNSDLFAEQWPKGLDRKGDRHKNAALVVWNDLNNDGQLQPNEVTIKAGSTGGVTVMPDGAFVLARSNGKCVRLGPVGQSAQGHPLYDLAKQETLATDVQGPASSGGDQALSHPNGWTVLTLATKPFHQHSLSGVFKGEPRWSYPNPWPGLHASHEAPQPEFPGEVIGTTRILGSFIEPTSGQGGPLWIVNGNFGPMYVFTADGLFVAQLFQDSRQGQPWKMPGVTRNMRLNELTPSDENFWPSVTQTADGRVYLIEGNRMSLVRVDGLDTIRRFPVQKLTVTEKDLQAAVAYQATREAARQGAKGLETLAVKMTEATPVVDGKLGDWSTAAWVPIDQRGVKAHFNSDSKPYDVQAAACVAGDRLYVSYRAGDAKLLRNSGQIPNALFKTGGALDLMLATDPAAPPNREQPAAGDLRLLVTLVKDRPTALLYRAVVAGTKDADRVPFSSPWRSIYFDRVDDVSADVQFATADGNYEISIPLKTLNLKPTAGKTIKADLGILRGDGTSTTARIYWANKATGITADVPSEAQLTPRLWGTWRFE